MTEANIIFWILIFCFILCVVLIYKAHRHTEKTGGRTKVKDIYNFPASKFENMVRKEVEIITGYKFPTLLPDWLKSVRGKVMEFDGYNEELHLAFEVQGPQHTLFDKKYHKNYETYFKTLQNDKEKRALCEQYGVGLIIIDYKVPKHLIHNYIISRIYDLCTKKSLTLLNCQKLRPVILKARTIGYLEKITNLPFRNPDLEKELNLPDL